MTRTQRPHSKADQDMACLRVWTAYRCLVLGKAGRHEVFHLLDAINIVRELVEMGKVNPATPVETANEGMSFQMRGEALSRVHLAALAEVCTQFDNAYFKLSISTIAEALKRFFDRINEGRTAADVGRKLAAELVPA